MTNFIIVIAVSLMMAFLFKASRKKPKEDENGNKILRLPVFYKAFGIVAIVFSVSVLILGYFTAKEGDAVYILMIFFLISSPGIVLVIAQKNIKTIITPDYIAHTSFFGKIKKMKWVEIKKISFGKITLELKLEDENQKIKVHMHAVGFNELIQEIENKTNLSTSNLGIPKI